MTTSLVRHHAPVLTCTRASTSRHTPAACGPEQRSRTRPPALQGCLLNLSRLHLPALPLHLAGPSPCSIASGPIKKDTTARTLSWEAAGAKTESKLYSRFSRRHIMVRLRGSGKVMASLWPCTSSPCCQVAPGSGSLEKRCLASASAGSSSPARLGRGGGGTFAGSPASQGSTHPGCVHRFAAQLEGQHTGTWRDSRAGGGWRTNALQEGCRGGRAGRQAGRQHLRSLKGQDRPHARVHPDLPLHVLHGVEDALARQRLLLHGQPVPVSPMPGLVCHGPPAPALTGAGSIEPSRGACCLHACPARPLARQLCREAAAQGHPACTWAWLCSAGHHSCRRAGQHGSPSAAPFQVLPTIGSHSIGSTHPASPRSVAGVLHAGGGQAQPHASAQPQGHRLACCAALRRRQPTL